MNVARSFDVYLPDSLLVLPLHVLFQPLFAFSANDVGFDDFSTNIALNNLSNRPTTFFSPSSPHHYRHTLQ